jgi:hypothetical protein
VPVDSDDNTIELSTEEKRCILGLQSYYIIFEQVNKEEALKKAWKDLKNEFPRLKNFEWFI